MDRVTVQDAARRLGVSEGAVRKRVARGTLEHDKEESGRVYVYLPAGVDGGVDDALVAQLRDEVVYLREMLRREQEINAMHASNMRALSAPESPAPDPETPVQEQEPPTEAESPENQSSRPWWAFWR